MNLLVDEGVHRQIVARLRDDGQNVLYVAEMEPGIPDETVLDLANRECRSLLTADKDFGELIFRQWRLTEGIILARLAGLSPERKALVLLSALQERAPDLLPGVFAAVIPGRIRRRR